MKKILLTLVGLCFGITLCIGQDVIEPQNCPWTPNYAYEKVMAVLGVVDIDGVEQYDWSLGVASFINGECRDAQLPAGDEDGHLIYVLPISGDDGDIITFKLWNEETGEELNLDTDFELIFDEEGAGFEEYIRFAFTTPATSGYQLEIAPYFIDDQETALNWYFISSPIGTVDVSEVQGLVTETAYDLYSFDQNGEGDDDHPYLEWRNFAAGAFDQLEVGKGYLYANKMGTTLTFTGTGYETVDGSISFPLDYYPEANYKGFNLMGNPFGGPATVSKPDFYVLANDEETMQSVYVLSEGVIAPMQGILVEALGEGDEIVFTAATGGAGGDDPDPDGDDNFKKLNLRVSGSNGSDLARIRFGQGHGLTKAMFSSNHTKLCFPVDNAEYAVVYAEDMGEMPVNFKASANGTYTLSLAGENVEFSYLHLIDNLTGADVDMLATPSYSFDALTTDYASRFKLVFATGNSDENFAFFSNGNFIISNEGEAVLQVVDVTGRILKNETINGSASVNVSAATGVYMLRLINGDNVKVQKVVVK